MMKSLLRFLPSMLLAFAVPAAAERGPAGTYRIGGERRIASGLQLQSDGRFQYFLSTGVLDERAEGRWRGANAS